MSIVRAIRVRTRSARHRLARSGKRGILQRAGHEIHETARISWDLVVRVPRLSVGPGTGINGRSTFKGGGPVDIGAYTSVSERVIIITNDHRLTGANVLLGLNHRFGWAPELTRVDRVAVGNAVWIGDRVTILPGVSIGDGAILAAGSVITRDVESFTVVAGVPARPIRPRFAPEVSQTLADIAWWTWPEARIARNREFFEADFTDMHPMDILNLVVS